MLRRLLAVVGASAPWVLGTLAGAVILLMMWGLSHYVPPVRSVPTPQVSVQEDDPGWDCKTMGNGVCGPVRPAVGPGWITHWEDSPDGGEWIAEKGSVA